MQFWLVRRDQNLSIKYLQPSEDYLLKILG